VKVGIVYNTGSYGVHPRTVIAVARHAESCGFESFYVPEHIVLYPGARVGPFEFPPALPIAAPLELLSFVAAATQRILLGTAVLLLPTITRSCWPSSWPPSTCSRGAGCGC
jgi:alkanesulfonate monooxygenase SsuD/methylene tetrahydromethanopterin reductase-like flavin-dependent oxidoreductase (luciferase family)